MTYDGPDAAHGSPEAPTRPPPDPSPPPAEPERLQRQTMVMVHDRGRYIMLVGLCTIAGVALGFGISAMLTPAQAQERVIYEARAPQVIVPPVPMPYVWGGGSCGLHRYGYRDRAHTRLVPRGRPGHGLVRGESALAPRTRDPGGSVPATQKGKGTHDPTTR